MGRLPTNTPLGTILYEMLTGRPPFQGMSTLDTLDMVRSKDPIPPSQLQPRMHTDIETICLKCLQKEPERRYANVLALAEDLRRFQAREPIVARPVSGAERLWRWCLRNKKLAGLYAAVASLVFILVSVFVGSYIIVIGQKNGLTVANDEKDKINVALATAKKLADDRRVEAETERQAADDKRKLAETAARAANEQNQSAVEAQLELIRLLERQLRYVPAIQNIRDELLDKAAGRTATCAAQGDDQLEEGRRLGPQGRSTQLADAGQGRARAGRAVPIPQPVRSGDEAPA